MKKMVALAAFAAVAATASFSYAGLQARSGVNGSLHDMNFYANATLQDGRTIGTSSNVDVYNRVCVFCHTPHNAIVDEPGDPLMLNKLPLWGNELTKKKATPYQWATPKNLEIPITDALAGPSRLCMTCHDGTIAVDAHISNGQQGNGSFKLSGSRAIGSQQSELNLTHPIGFSWDAAVTARNLPKGDNLANDVKEIVEKDAMFATAIDYLTLDATGYNTVTRNSNRTVGSVLYNGDIMTCASCHEVHNKENATQDLPSVSTAATPNYFLYAKESNSLICLSCHIK